MFLVQKLPRSEEDTAEEVMGANALFNRRMLTSIEQWRQNAWVLPVCGRTDMHHPSASRALHYTNVWKTTSSPSSSMVDTISSCQDQQLFVSPSILERQALELAKEARYAASLLDGSQDEDLEASLKNGKKGKTNVLAKKALKSFVANQAALLQGSEDSESLGLDSSSAGAGSSGSSILSSVTEAKQSVQLSQSLMELVQGISNEAATANALQSGAGSSAAGMSAVHDSTSNAAANRGTRFSHAAEFSKENTSMVGCGDVDYASLISGLRAAKKKKQVDEEDSEEEEVDGTAASMAEMRAARLADRAKAAEEALAARKKAAEEEEKAMEAEIEELRKAVQEEGGLCENQERVLEAISSKIRLLESEHSGLVTIGEAMERDILVKRKTMEMLPSAADNIGKLQQICAGSSARVMQLAQEWETHRKPLVEKYRSKKEQKNKRRDACRQMVEEMKRSREEMKAMIQDLKHKQEKSQLLEEEFQKLPKNINRNLYTYRIMEIIASISKQNKDIAKITNDIRDIQKTINSTSNTLQRADAVTEEKVYTVANASGSKDPAVVEAYRQLIQLRLKFENLIGTVNKIGAQEKNSRDLETKIDQETSRISSNNADRIKGDLQQVREENAQLVAQIKALK